MRAILTLLCAVAAGPAVAEDKYEIRIKVEPDVGKTVHSKSRNTTAGSMKFFDAGGKLLFEDKKEGEEKTYRGTVLARDKDGKPTKAVRVYETATEKENGKTKVLGRQGRTILIERVDGKPRIGVVGEPPFDAKEAEDLYRDIDKKSESKALLTHLSPGKPVKVGDSWSLPVKPLIEALEEVPADPEKSTATAKLVKVYEKGSSRFGTFEIVMKFVLAGKSERDGITMTFEKPGELTVDLTVDVAIDGTTVARTEKGTMAMKGEAAMDTAGQKVRVVFDLQGTGNDEVSAEADDPKAREIGKVVYLPAKGEWVEFKPKDGTWMAKFPGAPKEKTKKADGFTETQWSAEVEGGVVIYTVNVTTFADPSKLDPKGVLKAAAESLKGVKSQKDIEVNGFPGMDVVYEQDAKGFTFGVSRRMVMVNGRAIEVTTVALKGKTADTEKFFKSFQVLEKPQPKDD